MNGLCIHTYKDSLFQQKSTFKQSIMAVITAIAIGMTALTSLVLVIINTFGGLDRLKQETYTRDKFCLLDCSFTFLFIHYQPERLLA